MNHDSTFEFPEISDSDIRWASRLLERRDDAFHGTDGTDPRQDVLKSKEQIDVNACPGSGKTTLLVAKLAILARTWRHRTRGVCVVSHTNAARHVIESRLGNTPEGRNLLSYPHFVGTIHAFLNEFLALPFLRTQGYDNVRFSTDVSGDKIWKLCDSGRELPKYVYRKFTDGEKRKQAVRQLHYVGENLDLLLKAENSRVRLKRQLRSGAFERLDQWKDTVLREGYAAYEDTFGFACRALRQHPWLAPTIRDRFPILFIDEAQDNTEDQSAILGRIFLDGGSEVVRQRFGDENQAIFHSNNAEEATTDRFPNGMIKEIPNSHRFGESIARLAGPLGITRYSVRLKGQGPKCKSLASGATEGRHTVFLFDDDQVTKVLDAYGGLLLSTFSDEELQEGSRNGSFTAVGHVHFDKGDDHWPRHIRHYWPEYDPELSKTEPKPNTFLGYVAVGLGKSKACGEAHLAVEMVAAGVIRLAEMADNRRFRSRHRYNHRHILQQLEQHDDLRERYQEFVSNIVVKKRGPKKQPWEDCWCNVVRHTAERIAECSLTSAEADEFLSWADAPVASACQVKKSRSRDNIYLDDNEIAIRVGSIHSVKGQTHKATLVLETFWQDNKGRHNLELLLPWLCGSKSGAASVGVQQKSRLKLHYVAMTRPTHLLCLAMKKSTFQNDCGELDEQLIETFKKQGWNVEPI